MSESEKVGKVMLSSLKNMNIKGLNKSMKHYMNLPSFSPHQSDSEGTSAYKRLRREMLEEKT